MLEPKLENQSPILERPFAKVSNQSAKKVLTISPKFLKPLIIPLKIDVIVEIIDSMPSLMLDKKPLLSSLSEVSPVSPVVFPSFPLAPPPEGVSVPLVPPVELLEKPHCHLNLKHHD